MGIFVMAYDKKSSCNWGSGENPLNTANYQGFGGAAHLEMQLIFRGRWCVFQYLVMYYCWWTKSCTTKDDD